MREMKEERFQAILQGLEEARRFARGEIVPGLRYHPAPPEDARAIRKRTGLSQAAFARQIGVPLATLRNWESARRCPVGPARVLLALLANDLAIIARTLSEAARGCRARL
jgi:putative transcriptional regulator